MKRYNIMDLFSGVGGLSYGFSCLPDFKILAANEIERDIAAAYSLNHPDVKMLNCDINDLSEEMLFSALNGRQIDVVVGGPPASLIPLWGNVRWMTVQTSSCSISAS